MDEQKIRTLLGKRIKEFRNIKGITQFALGEAIGINQRQVAQIECGKSFPSFSTLNKLSDFFNCNINDFFNYEHLMPLEELKTFLLQYIQDANYASLQKIYKYIKMM